MGTACVLTGYALGQGVKDADATLRASSLSALAEICGLLRFAIHAHLAEVLVCVRDVVLSDQDVQVSLRAAGPGWVGRM
jgi:hypothetical protein